MSMDQRETDSKSESLMESVEVDVIADTDADEEEVLLEDDSADEDVVEEETF